MVIIERLFIETQESINGSLPTIKQEYSFVFDDMSTQAVDADTFNAHSVGDTVNVTVSIDLVSANSNASQVTQIKVA